MSSRGHKSFYIGFVALVALAAVPAGTANTAGGLAGNQRQVSTGFFSTPKSSSLTRFPTIESLAQIPAITDPSKEVTIPVSCNPCAFNKGKPVKNAKGNFTAELIVLDNPTGTFETFDIDSGKFKTTTTGCDDFTFAIPTELFADGFESGDVSAWSYIRTDFTDKKKNDSASMGCGISAQQ